jgi:hypothetical protein
MLILLPCKRIDGNNICAPIVHQRSVLVNDLVVHGNNHSDERGARASGGTCELFASVRGHDAAVNAKNEL